MASKYQSILQATQQLLQAQAGLAGWSVVIRDHPAWVPLLDSLPAIVVAPRADLVERVVQNLFPDSKGGVSKLAYTVYVGGFVDDRAQDQANLWRRTDAREVCRVSLWKAGVLNLGATVGEFDVNYDPSGAGGEPPPPNVKGSWQAFEFVAGAYRNLPG